jgi:SWI/SNF-related matrix-associated actin-dependent regulator of chromatin subfamily A-like protein 1
MNLLPYQDEGARFLAARHRALLADAPRVGKTAQAIRACNAVGARSVLWITTGSARADHAAAWRQFDLSERTVEVCYSSAELRLDRDVTILSWDLAVSNAVFPRLLARGFDVLILDEAHRAKSRGARRTQLIYGPKFDMIDGLVDCAKRIWLLTGTPAPNDYSELWPMLHALAPETIMHDGKPMSFTRFKNRYCQMRWNGFAWTVVKNKNGDELRKRIEPFFLRRTLKDVAPWVGDGREDLLHLGDRELVERFKRGEAASIVSDIEKRLGTTLDRETREKMIEDLADEKMHARLSRLTGLAKVDPFVAWLEDEAPEKLVVFAHHHDVIDALVAKRPDALVVTGNTRGRQREIIQRQFREDKAKTLFVGQIQAAGEAIDLSVADELVFLQSSYVPKDNEQAANRIRNINKDRPVFVRFATLAGSIDEHIQSIAKRKLQDIRKIFK